ncbi:MAG TPA: NAD-dependent epimerase/dehydratase family protein [Chthonomonadaceae bacterium]|nr:NAD-dependent epimerase/dehydratase family protein [Chthonomonadaceae bacterium]
MAISELEPMPATEGELEERLSRPTPALLETLTRLDGDILVLGVGGKMGPSLARMARRGLDAVGKKSRVIGVARFSDKSVESALTAVGVEAHRCDLMDRKEVAKLPDARNVVYMAGLKFGTSRVPEQTWAMNTLAPAIVAERYYRSRMVVFSTGCVYPNTPVPQGGSLEQDALEPLGEYANACVARERLFHYFAVHYGIPIVLLRLNYAIDLRYGVLLDVAQRVATETPIDLTMGHVNVIWQGDANAWALQSLELANVVPPIALNVTGPETLSIRYLALRFGDLLDKTPLFTGTEAETALLSNAGRAFGQFGYPTVTLEQMIHWVAAWVRQGGRTLNKPTHFEARDGRF